MKTNYEQLEEINSLFEFIKTMLITGLYFTKVKQLLKKYTHSEIRKGKYKNGEFIVDDLVTLD